KPFNAETAGPRGGMTLGTPPCRGNGKSTWLAQGGYEPVARAVFQETDVDGWFLEYDTERAGSFEPLRQVPRGKKVVLGLVSTKTPVLEKKDDLKGRIGEAATNVPLEKLHISPGCGFAGPRTRH